MTTALRLDEVAEALLPRRDRLLIWAALVAVVSLGWGYLVLSAAHMDMEVAAHAAMGMMAVPWTPGHFVLTFLMWAVMMVAMMLPSTAPAVLTYGAVVGRVAPAQKPLVSTALFALAYILVWAGFSLTATLLQWGLEQAALLSPVMATSSGILGGSLLILAGLYQWAPLKDFCLKHCQIPLSFIAAHWRPGAAGALAMGIRHGVYCVGCCWALMLLLFVGGVMNLLWVAAISVFVLMEKLIGSGTRAGRWLSGGALVAAGVFVLGA